MRKRSKPSLKLSLLSYAIAAAAAGLAPGAQAVDLCAGNATTTISTDASGNTCTLDTSGATLSITATGAIDDVIQVNITNPVITNAGAISESASNAGWTSAFGIQAGNLGTGGAITNSGTISVTVDSTTSQASANGIRVNNMSGAASVTNSGTITTTVHGDDWAAAYAMGSWANMLDGASLANTSTGVITATASADSVYYASAYGMFAPAMFNGSSLSNDGSITATATGIGTASASAYGIFQYSGLVDASITNTGTITADATATGDEWAGAWGILSRDSMGGTASISNSGQLTASADGQTATAYGIKVGSIFGTTLTNSGTITATAEGDSWAQAYAIQVDTLSGTGSVVNSGTITATATSVSSSASAWGIHTGNLGGSMSNSGTLAISATADDADNWAGAYGMGTWNGGTMNGESLTNDATGSIAVTASGWYGSAYGIAAWTNLTNGSSIDNQGTIAVSVTGNGGNYASAWGIDAYRLADSSLSNSGSIIATAGNGNDWAGAWGINVASQLTGDSSVTNSGTLTVSASVSGSTYASAFGIDVNGLADTSSLANSGDIVVSATATSGYVYAYGIDAYSLDGAATVTNSGTISVTGTADTWASAYGINTSDLTGTAAISNSGTITATATSATDSASAWGIRTGALNSGSISNSGTITATATAMPSDTATTQWGGAHGMGTWTWTDMNGVALTNTDTGIITATASGDRGSAYGILAYGELINGGSISNAGTITVTTTGGDASYASAYGIYASTLTDSSISNSGTVTASATGGEEWTGAWGIIAGSLNVDASISNAATGTLNASIATDSYGSVYGIETNGLFGTSTITNSGTISATGTANTWISAYGIDVDSVSDSASIANSGTITATATSLNSEGSAWGIHTGYMYGGSVSNSGDIVVSASTSSPGMWAGAYGMGSWDWSTMSGFTLENAAGGTIVATVAADSGSAHGLLAWGDLYSGSSISNAGTIELTANGGDVWAGAYGILAGNVDGTSTISNSGTISVTTTVTGSATGSAYGIFVGTLAGGGTVTNSGTITVTGGAGVETLGIVVNNGGSGTVVNTATGDIGGGVRLNGTVSLQNDGNVTLAAGQGSHVGGDYTQGATGQLTTVVKDVATYGSVAVSGTADLSAGSTLVVELDPTLQLADGDVLENVVSAGTLTLPVAGVDIVDSSLFWDFANVGDATTIDLEANQVTAASVLAGSGVAFTATQLDMVNAIVGGSAGTQYAALTGALNAAPNAAAAAALVQQAGPTLSGAASQAVLAASSGIGALIDARQAETGAASGDAFTRNGVWLKTFLGNADQDAVNGVGAFSADSTGFVLGLDGNAGDDWRLGVAVASAATDADDVNSSLEIDTLQFTLYGSYAVSDSTALDLDIDHAVNSIDSRRVVGFAGSTAVASYDGRQTALGASLTHRAEVCSGFAVLPGVSLRYRQVHLDGYSETGAGAFDLTVQGRSDSALLWQAKLGMEVGLGGFGTLLGSVGAGYDTLDAATATATLSGTGPTFIAQGAKPESTVLDAGIGYRYVTAKGFEINALYELEDRDSFSADTASLKFRMAF